MYAKCHCTFDLSLHLRSDANAFRQCIFLVNVLKLYLPECCIFQRTVLPQDVACFSVLVPRIQKG